MTNTKRISREKRFNSIRQQNPTVLLVRKRRQPMAAFTGNSLERKFGKRAQGVITLTCTRNNTYLHYLSYVNGLVRKASAGSLSKGALRKKSGYINSLLGETFGKQLREQDVSVVDLTMQSFGRGRDGALSGLRKSGLNFRILKQRAIQPHNGCRPPKMRRL